MTLKLGFSLLFAVSIAFSVANAHGIHKSPEEARNASYQTSEADARAFLQNALNGSKRTRAAMPAWVRPMFEDWTNTNSGSFNFAGLESMRAKVKPLFTALGYTAQEIEIGEAVDPQGNKFIRKILVFDFPGTNPDTLILGHLDTVFELSHPFQKFFENGTEWHGPGVADMKGGIILTAHMLQELKDPTLLKRIRIIINDDEERGSSMSEPFLKKYALQAAVGLMLEAPFDSDITPSHSGLLWAETNVLGVASHAGQAHAAGVNACLDNSYKMIKMYGLLDYSRGLTINAGIVNTSASAKPNITCDSVTTTYDVRYISTKDAQRAREKFKTIMAKNYAPNLTKAVVPPSVYKEIQFTPAMPPERSKELVKIYQDGAAKLGLTITAKHKGAVDAYGIIDAPLKLLSGLGVYGTGLHSDKEFMQSELYMRKLELNVAFMRELLK